MAITQLECGVKSQLETGMFGIGVMVECTLEYHLHRTSCKIASLLLSQMLAAKPGVAMTTVNKIIICMVDVTMLTDVCSMKSSSRCDLIAARFIRHSVWPTTTVRKNSGISSLAVTRCPFYTV